MIFKVCKYVIIGYVNSFLNVHVSNRYVHSTMTRLTATAMNGKDMSNSILSELKKEVDEWVEGGNKRPAIKVLKIGDSSTVPSLNTTNILNAAHKLGIEAQSIVLPKDIREIELLADIRKFNEDRHVDAIMVELPLPDHISDRIVSNAVAPHKDMDGRNIINVGRLLLHLNAIIPSTAAAICEIIRRHGIQTSGKYAVICGRSLQIGRPIATILCGEPSEEFPGMNATISVCHRYSSREQLSYLTKGADIVISACGIPNLIEAKMLKQGVCVIDVGANIIFDEKSGTKLVGDVNYEEVKELASLVTPVPGGVGPVSVAMAMKNVLTLAKKKIDYNIFEPGAMLHSKLTQSKQ